MATHGICPQGTTIVLASQRAKVVALESLGDGLRFNRQIKRVFCVRN